MTKRIPRGGGKHDASPFIWGLGCLLLLVGCGVFERDAQKEPAGGGDSSSGPAELLEPLRQENSELRRRIQVLTGIPEAARGSVFHQLETVRLTRYTGIYDKDEDGLPEKLLVYIKPIDMQGDIVKSPAQVEIQLWNLEKNTDQTLLQTWMIEPETLQEQWFATLVTINYRLVFDLPREVNPQAGGLMVKMVFTDLFSGQTFTDQRAVVSH